MLLALRWILPRVKRLIPVYRNVFTGAISGSSEQTKMMRGKSLTFQKKTELKLEA